MRYFADVELYSEQHIQGPSHADLACAVSDARDVQSATMVRSLAVIDALTGEVVRQWSSANELVRTYGWIHYWEPHDSSRLSEKPRGRYRTTAA